MYTNLAFSILCRGVQVVLSILTIHQLVQVLGVDNYGLWVTLTSVMAWMALFDFGIGYGLKNRLSEAYASGKKETVGALLSSVYFIYVVIAALILIMFSAAAYFVSPFSENIPASLVLVFCASVSFLFSIGAIILQAVGAFKRFYFFSLLVPVGWFIFVVSNKGVSLSVGDVVWVFGGLMVVQSGLLFASGRTFFSADRFIFSYLSRIDVRNVLLAGGGFFILQLSSLFLFMSGNFLVYQLAGPSDVASYDVINKVYQLFGVGYSILITLAWTGISKAKALGDVKAKVLVFKGLALCSVLVLVSAALLASQIGPVTSLISAGKIVVSSNVALVFSFFVFVQSVAYSGAVFLNAYERLVPQIVLAIIAVPIFICLAYYLLSNNFGIAAVPAACSIAILPSAIYCFIHGYKLARQPQ
ncbi:O-antigen/teichoic acid export membrane protein [Pseudomonas sp. TE3786]